MTSDRRSAASAPYCVVVIGQHETTKWYRSEQSVHKEIGAAVARANAQWMDYVKFFNLPWPIWTWIVVDRRDGRTIWHAPDFIEGNPDEHKETTGPNAAGRTNRRGRAAS